MLPGGSSAVYLDCLLYDPLLSEQHRLQRSFGCCLSYGSWVAVGWSPCQ